MTGYGVSEFIFKDVAYKAEVKSYNSKGLDIKLNITENLYEYEFQIIAFIKKYITRGSVRFLLKEEVSKSDDGGYKIFENIALKALDYKKKFSEEHSQDIDINYLLSSSKMLSIFSKDSNEKITEEEFNTTIKQEILKVLEKYLEMSHKEGENLKSFFENTFLQIENHLNVIDEKKDVMLVEYKEKLKNRVEELLESNVNIDENILENEIAFFAAKSDIKEEITRLRSHIKQVRTYINKKNEAVGNNLNFLFQEMLREANTIGSKSNSLEITNEMLQIKNLISSLKEQVLNIE